MYAVPYITSWNSKQWLEFNQTRPQITEPVAINLRLSSVLVSPNHPSPHLPPSTAPEMVSIGVAHPNLDEGNYGGPSDRLFSVDPAQADGFDGKKSESWEGDTDSDMIFIVCCWTVP